LHHFMWQYMEEDDPRYGPMFLDAYRQIDRLAGRIIGKLRGGDDELIVLSDHGFTTLKREVYLNVWLEEEGYLRFRPGPRKDLETIAPSTRAFSLDPGRIYVNLAGREPGGSVSPEERERLLQDMASRLRGLRDPDNGDVIVRDVFRRDDIYHGPLRDRAPDLLVMPCDGYDIKGTFDATTLTGRGPLVGMHKYDNATLFVRGRRITVDHASVHDVLPTACHLMGLECPPEVDGRVCIA
ncbi:MAG: alkaline phosphatase family protein, partial [Chloroflexi bacterium]|nr:alkaline phosphatase family protein [Chloroflexota bacterium]